MNVRTVAGNRMRAALRRQGWIVQKPTPGSDPDLRRARLLETYRIATVLDVGANDGMYGTWLRGAGYTGTIHSFEPVERPFLALQERCEADPLWHAHRIALSDTRGTATINVSSRDTWSSLLPMDRRADASELDYVATQPIETARLDDLDLVQDDRVWLKLDVQGFERQVLAGAKAALQRVVAVECELNLQPLYEGQASPRELIDFFDDHGLVLIGTEPGRVRADGRTVWVDCVFARR